MLTFRHQVTTYEERHIYYSIAGTFLFAGAAIGPLVGGLIEGTVGAGARDLTRWLVPIVSFVTILPYAFLCAESYAPVLARQRRQAEVAREAQTGSLATLVNSPLPSRQRTVQDLRVRYTRALTLPCIFATREPLIICVTAYVSLVYFFVYCALEAFPYTFGQLRGWSMRDTSLTFLALLAGFLLSTVFPLCTTQQRYISRTVSSLAPGERMRPEARLSDMRWCGFVAPAGLFLFAWTAPFPAIHWAVPLTGMLLFSFAINVAFTDFLPYLADV